MYTEFCEYFTSVPGIKFSAAMFALHVHLLEPESHGSYTHRYCSITVGTRSLDPGPSCHVYEIFPTNNIIHKP